MAAAVFFNLLTATKQVIDALHLVDWSSNPVPSEIRKLPKAEEGLDTLPLIAIAPNEIPERISFTTFENQIDCQYQVEIVIIAAGDRDFQSHLDTYMDWREKLRGKFQSHYAAVATGLIPTVWKAEMLPELMLDRRQLNNNYDYSGLSVRFYSLEKRDH